MSTLVWPVGGNVHTVSAAQRRDRRPSASNARSSGSNRVRPISTSTWPDSFWFRVSSPVQISARNGLRRDRPCSCTNRTKRSEEHTSELQSLMRISYAVFFLNTITKKHDVNTHDHYIRFYI